MVNYFKKVLVFKKINNCNINLKGLAIVECLDDKTTFSFEFLSKLNEKYSLFISGEDSSVKLINPPNSQKFKASFDGFKVLGGLTVIIVNEDTPIYYGLYGKSYYDLNGIINYAKTEFNETKKEKDFTANNVSINQNETFNDYDDERIATENYYKINDEQNGLHNQNASLLAKCKKAEEIEENEKQFGEYEKNPRTIENQPFHEKVKEKLDEIFSKFEECKELENALPNGKFVKIHYADNNYYYVGKIENNNEIEYICYGVTGQYGNIPNNFEKHFTFIPLSNYELSGKGFYLIFQDANTGEIIKKQE